MAKEAPCCVNCSSAVDIQKLHTGSTDFQIPSHIDPKLMRKSLKSGKWDSLDETASIVK
jgi:hypothetical protein